MGNYTKIISYRGVSYLLTREDERRFHALMDERARELAEPYEDSERDTPEYPSAWEVRQELDDHIGYALARMIGDQESRLRNNNSLLRDDEESLVGELLNAFVSLSPYPHGNGIDNIVTIQEAAEANIMHIVDAQDSITTILESYGVDTED